MSQALRIHEFRDSVKQLAKEIDLFKYNNSLTTEAGKALATAINELTRIEGYLKDAGYEEAMEELCKS